MDPRITIGKTVGAIGAIGILFFMLSCGVALDASTIAECLRRRNDGKTGILRAVTLGLFVQVMVNPVVSCIILSFFTMDYRTRVAAVLIACSPSGQGSNFWVLFSNGSIETSVVMSTISTILSVVTMPMFFYLGINVFLKSETSVVLPWTRLLVTILTCIGPLWIGVGLRRRFSMQRLRPLVYTGIVLGGVAVGLAFVSSAIQPQVVKGLKTDGLIAGALGLLLNVAALILGYGSSRAFRLAPEFHRTLAFEVSCQNMPIPIGVVILSFPEEDQPQYMVMMITYWTASLLAVLPFAIFLRLCFPIKKEEADAEKELHSDPEKELGPEVAEVPGLEEPEFSKESSVAIERLVDEKPVNQAPVAPEAVVTL